MKLSGSERKNLEEALLAAFDSFSLKRMVRIELEDDLESLVATTSLAQIVFELVTIAEKGGWVHDLIVGACRANPSNKKLARVARQLLDRHAVDQNSDLAARLHINRPIKLVEENLRNTTIGPYGSMFDGDGLLCRELPLKTMPRRYFIAQEFNNHKDDLRMAIEQAMAQFNYRSIRADDLYWGGPILCKISALIQGTPFGIYQLTASQNRNVYLELGIAIGLGRPFVLVKDRKAEVARLAGGLEYYQINSYFETRYQLGDLLKHYVTEIGEFRPESSTNVTSQKSAIVAHGGLDPIDFTITIAKNFQKYGYTTLVLGKQDAELATFLRKEDIDYRFISTLDDTVTAIQSSRFGVYRVDKSSDADGFISYGIALAQNKKGILVRNSVNTIPSDLHGLNIIDFSNLQELNDSLKPQLDGCE